MSSVLVPSEPEGLGGERGGSVHGTSGMNEGVNSFTHSFKNGDSAESVLLSYGVFALSPSKRQSVAEHCEKLKIEPSELHALLDYVRSGEPNEGMARRYMAAIVGDETRLRVAVEGFRAFLRAQAAHRRPEPQDDGPAHMVNMPFGTPSCHCNGCVQARAKQAAAEPWDHDRMCRVAWCRVTSDRRPRAEVARELGVSETTLGTMLDRGRQLSTSVLLEGRRSPSPRAVRQLESAEAERRKQFHEQMREARMRQEFAQ